VDGVHVVGLDDEEERVLGVRAVATDQLDARDVGVVERVGTARVPGTELRTVDLCDVEEHRDLLLR
jgi:hypothetical protein